VPTNRQGVVQLLRALERGEIVGILPDQEPDLSGGEFAPFFGKDALTMTLAARLANKTGAAVLCGFARRLPESAGFELVYRRADPQVASTEPLLAATALNRSVEACVLEEPMQYQWEYKRFKKRPPTDPEKVYR
jgi:Kdo2-lipid IVA lauroyltransferase/acyltransferase